MILFVAGRTVGTVLGDFGCTVFAGVPTLYVASFLSLLFVTGIAETKCTSYRPTTIFTRLHISLLSTTSLLCFRPSFKEVAKQGS